MADVKLTVIVPDKYVAQVVEMMELLEGETLHLGTDRHFGPYGGLTKYLSFPKRENGETRASQAQKLIREFLLTCLGIVELNKTRLAKEAIYLQGETIKEKVVEQDSVIMEEVT